MHTSTRPRREATPERCPLCRGKGFEYAECAGSWPYEVTCAACRGAGAVEAFPEPPDFGPDPDVDGDVDRYWDCPLPPAA